jgi:hypothetical protein
MPNDKESSSDDILYAEKPKPAWLRPAPLMVKGAIIGIICAWVLVYFFVWGIQGYTFIRIGFPILMGMLQILSLWYFLLLIIITTDVLKLKAGWHRWTIKREAIESCEPYEMHYKNYVRIVVFSFRKRKPITFNTRSGPGIILRVTSLQRTFIIGTDNPEEILSVLTKS